ncbi:hypothetical protein VTG60DRAFT_933 [Thermothelomyces hinnuleus]
MRIALHLTARGHPERWLRLRNLSAALLARGRFRHHHEDLASAVIHAREALAAVPPLSAVRERLVIHLADILELHYTETADPRMRNLDEINECIRWTREVKILYRREDHRGDSAYQIHRWNSILSLLSTMSLMEKRAEEGDRRREPFDPLRPAFRHHPHDGSYLGDPFPNAGYGYWLENLPHQTDDAQERRTAHATIAFFANFGYAMVENPGPTRAAEADAGRWYAEQTRILLAYLVDSIESEDHVNIIRGWIYDSPGASSRAPLLRLFASQLARCGRRPSPGLVTELRILALRKAVQLSPAGTGALVEGAIFWLSRCMSVPAGPKRAWNLEEALLFAKTALSSDRLSKRQLVGRLNVMAAISAVRYQTNNKQVEVLNGQIRAGEMACRIADRGDSQTRLAFHNLSLGYRARFQSARDKRSRASVFDMERAVATEILAIAYSASRVANRARLWMSLGNTYMARYDAFGGERDRAEAIWACLQAAGVASAGSPLVRITALTTAARLQASTGRPADALKSFERAIGLSQPVRAREEDLPRVWWIGVGLLAHFPFHAAGCYSSSDDGSGESAMDLVNSTYIPTLKSLLYAREKRAALPDTAHATACFVTMETTPGYPRLDGVEDEARLIQAAFPPAAAAGTAADGVASFTTLVHPRAAQVADHIGHCDVLHLACHAKSDMTDPSRSNVVLARTDPDGRGVDRPDKLFVEDIMRKSSGAAGAAGGAAARIAFLRACYSADNPAVGLSDEAIHLASAFHLAGFTHAPESQGTNPFLWASFVHVGA